MTLYITPYLTYINIITTLKLISLYNHTYLVPEYHNLIICIFINASM